MINTIGPVWDGNEVWLLTAGGATFAAFPAWYAAMFSALLPAAACDPRRADHPRRRVRVPGQAGPPALAGRWDAAIFLGSLVPALLWGVAFGNILHGIPINAQEHFTGNFWTFLNPYALLGGVTTLTLFTLHGALFLALKTTDNLRARAIAAASVVGLVAIVAGAGFLGLDGAVLPGRDDLR